MKLRILSFAMVLGSFAIFSCNQGASNAPVSLSKDVDSVSYSIGTDVGRGFYAQLAQAGLDSVINVDAVVKGIQDVLKKEENLLIDQETGRKIVEVYMGKQREIQMQKRTADGEKNKEAGIKFLAENKTKEGVITLESGLQYQVINEGTGASPSDTSTVKVHYHGTLIDGTVFDSSVDRGQPIDLQVNGVIAGWTEALQLMKAGAKWKLFIPQDLAYGERGGGPKILPFSTLIFDVELLEVVK